MGRLAGVFVLGVSLAVSGVGWAEEESPSENEFARDGFYVRGGVALGFEQLEVLDTINASLVALLNADPSKPPNVTFTSAALEIDPMVGVSIGAGSRVHPRIAIEAAFDWARGDVKFNGSATVSGAPQSFDVQGGEFSAWMVMGEAKVFLLTNRFQPYGAIGIGGMGQTIEDTLGAGISGSASGFAPRFGGGVDVYMTPNLAVNVDAGYVLGTGDLDTFDLVTLRLGLVGRF